MLKPYVYVLIDPRKNNSIFYVGKGKGNRATHHIIETEKEISNLALNSDFDLKNAITNVKKMGLEDKQTQIAELLNLQYKAEDICRVVAILDTDEEAFACESLLIHFVYGLNNLSNIQAGHKSSRFRPHTNWDLLGSLDYPLIFRDKRKKLANQNEYINRQNDLDNELTKLEDYGLVSIIDQIAGEFEGEWDHWAIRGAWDVSRQLLVIGPENYKYKIKLWGKTSGEGYVCMEMRGAQQAMGRLENDLGIGHLLRGDKCFYPKKFGSNDKTKDIKILKKRLSILKNIAESSNVEMLNAESLQFIKEQ